MGRVEIPFAGSSKQHRSPAIANQICENWFIEIERDDQGKEMFRSLIGTPGKTLITNVSNQSCRALHSTSSKYSKYWGVFGDTIYEFLNNDTSTILGKILTDQGRVYIADNGTHLLIVDGTNKGYSYDIGAGVLTTITDVNFVGGDYVVFMHGYFIVIQPGTNILHACQAPYGTAPTTWTAGAVFSTALQDAGPLIALGVSGDLLWAIGDYSTALFQDTGNPTGFPFSLITGVPLNYGIDAKASLAELRGSLIWSAKTKKGAGFIVQTEGMSLKKISDSSLSYNIGSYASAADAYADTYIEEDHGFYQITFPTGNKTWVFDVITNEWHSRSSSGLGRDRAFGHIFFLGRHIVGDHTNGNLYECSLDVYTENGQPLISKRRCQHLKSAKNQLEIPELIIDMETGVGIAGDVQGSDPQAELRYSIDGGKTWSDPLLASMGRIGDYKAELRYPRLGQSDDWVFELMVSDPVKRNLVGAYVGS